MIFQKKYIVTLSLALGLPSSTLALAIAVYNLVEKEVLNAYLGYGILFFYIIGTVFLIYWYAAHKKN